MRMDNRSLGEGCQPDGITVYGGRVDRGMFPIVTRGRVTIPNQNLNSLANRMQAFHTFLEYCREFELKVEFWDVHFSQGSFKQLRTNEKNKSKKYSDAFSTFIQREDEEFAPARENMRHLNSNRRGAPLVSLFGMCLSGALSDGAIKVIEKLAMIKYPTPPTEGNPSGTLSYLPMLWRYLLNLGSRYVRLMLQDSYRRTMRSRQVKRDPAGLHKYLDGSLHIFLQWM